MQTNKFLTFIILVIIHLFSIAALAEDISGIKWSEIRFFLTGNTFAAEPTAINNLVASDNVEKFKSTTGFGLEAVGQFKPWLKVGTRIKGFANATYPPNAPPTSVARLGFSQYAGGIVGRVPLVDKESVYLDAFAELGVANTSIDVQTNSSGKVTYSKDAGLYQRAGASFGLGSASTKILIEGGYEFNNITGMSQSGSLGSNISSVDMSGPYYMIGLIISGIPSWIKPGGITTK